MLDNDFMDFDLDSLEKEWFEGIEILKSFTTLIANIICTKHKKKVKRY